MLGGIMAIEVLEKEVTQRTLRIDKEDLIEILESKIAIANVPIALTDKVEFRFKCWDHKGARVCEDLSKLEVIITRVRSM
jgi:hypothetical protein